MASKSVKIFGVILVVLLVLFGILVFALFRMTRLPDVEVRNESVLELSLGGEFADLPVSSPWAQLAGRGKISLFEVGRVFRAAADDDRISAIYLKVYPLLTSWAEVEEIRSLMHQFRKSKKKIYAHLSLDLVNEIELYLASAADEIHLNQDAALMVNGLMAEFTFFKKMMDRLKVRPDVLQFKEFKSPESYTRSKLTREIRTMYEGILADIQQRFVKTISQEREVEAQQLQALMRAGILSAPSALTARLVTHIGYEDEIRSRLEVKSPDAEAEYRSISASEYLREINQRKPLKTPHKVALLAGVGPILSGEGDEIWGSFMGGDTMVSRLREIRESEDVKGLLFRVNSPGGTVVGSDKIWREVRLLEEAGKPVVISMVGVAGSGGYYIAMGASKIVAQPSTITGSIGVIFQKLDLSGLLDNWLGITVDQVKLAENADILSLMTSLSFEQKGQLQAWMRQIYNSFVEKAAEGRHLTVEELEQQAGGRIFTGNQAKERKLIDEVGGLYTALGLLKQELKIPQEEEVELVLYPKPKSLWKSFLDGDWAQLYQPPQSLESLLRQRFLMMQKPAPWLLAPELIIH